MTAIAIVGMGCRFAGASDLQAYWRLTLEGRHAFGPVPDDRWDAALFYSENTRAADKSYAPAGAFIQDIRSFPALTLGLPPRRVEVMDPQHRFALESCLQAVEDAGYIPAALPHRTAVFMGVTANEYRELQAARMMAPLMASGALGEAPEDPAPFARAVQGVAPTRPYSAPGSLSNMTAATVAQELDLHGPAYTVDSACASALIAIGDAVRQLRSGLIDAALAGGVYLCVTPDHHIAFSRVGAMSKSGVCRPFDARADGFVQGDGVGVVLLKRVEDAIEAGDRIYAVIHGLALNSDGRGDGPMAPSFDGQCEVIRGAWDDAGVSPSRLGYVEAHGTGTAVGDPTEFSGLATCFPTEEGADAAVIGSSKANVGHTMSAAGVAGLIRAALAIHHKIRPPMAGYATPREDLALEGSRFTIPTAPVAWESEDRLAGVSSFGFGGTNAHAVLGAAPPPPITGSEQPELILMSAPDQEVLRDLAGRTADAIASDPTITVAGVARAWQLRRRLAARLAVVARTRDEVVARLRTFAEGGAPEECHWDGGSDPSPSQEAPPVAFLYPGQGAQRLGMMQGVTARFPVAAEAMDRMEGALSALLPVPLSHLIDPTQRASPVSDEEALAELTKTACCQPAMLACGVALGQVLAQVGVRPAVVAGHSLGEFTAAACAGVLSDEDAVRFVARRGAAMEALGGDAGAMAALRAPEEEARGLLVDGAVIANVNHPKQVVVSGTTDAVAAVTERAREAGVEAVVLRVSHGFHSPVLGALDVSGLVADLSLSEPQVSVASAIDGELYRDGDHARAIFARHATSPVRFTDALTRCQAEGAQIFLQVGEGGPLAAFARGTVGADARGVLSLASREDTDGGTVLQTLGRLWTLGVPVDTAPITGPSPVASVPPSVLPRERYWVVRDDGGRPVDMDRSSTAVKAPSGAAHAVASPQASPPTDGDVDDLEGQVIAVVAKVSAYPVGAVRPSMRLMGELGFDSLMMGDLVTGLTERFEGLDGIPQELLINDPTVADLVDHVRSGGGTEVVTQGPLQPWTPGWVPAPIGSLEAVEEVTGRVLLVTDTPDALAPVVSGFTAAGLEVSLSSPAEAGQAEAADLVVWWEGSASPDQIAAVCATTRSMPTSVPELVRALRSQMNGGATPDCFVVGSAGDPLWGGLRGLTRAVGRDWPEGRVRTVTVSAEWTPETVGQALLAEWMTDDRTVDVSYGADGRQVAAFEPAPAVADAPVGAEDVVLITGGTGDLGERVAAAMLATGARVVLLGRRPAPQALLDRLGAPPDRLVCVQADVCDAPALADAIAPHGPFTVLVHGAGVLADGPLDAVDPADGQRALTVKAQGWLNALAAAGPSLRVAGAMGSWSGRFGNRHQGWYAAANAQLAGLASEAPEGVRVVISEFGPWTSSRMVQTIPTAIRAAMGREGVDFVEDEEGVVALLSDLQTRQGVVVHASRRPDPRALRQTLSLDTDAHPYLRDHAIEGVPVLPLASALDLVAHGSQLAPPFEIRDLTLFQGVAVSEPVDLSVHAIGGRVELRSGDPPRLAYRARVQPVDAGAVSWDPCEGGGASALSAEAFYDGVTFHGPLLQGILSVDGVGDDFVRGRVRSSSPGAWMPGTSRSRWAVDPLAVDSAFQLAALVAWTRHGRAGTPVGIKRYAQLTAWGDAPLIAEVRFLEQDADRFTADVALRAEDGTLVALASGVVAELRAAEEGADGSEASAPREAFQPMPEHTDPGTWSEVKDLQLRFKMAEAAGIRNPYFTVHDGTARDTTKVAGRELVNFSSYNYLGLSGDPVVVSEVQAAIGRYGTSVSASRVASGERAFHGELERSLARCQGVEDALLFTAGHAVNVSTIGHLFGPDDLILHDELIHDSALGGIKMSGATRRSFRHEDAEHLGELLAELRPHYAKALIVVEGVYSMDGDICNLPPLLDLKTRYGCLLMVDEAHSFGVIGATGQGLREHWDIEGPEVDLWMGTLSKSLASCGGWIAGSKTMIDYLRYTVGGFVFSAGLTPANGQAALSALRIMLAEPARVQALQENARIFHEALSRRGLDTGPALGGSAVIPCITGNSMHALKLSQRLLDVGINVQPIVFPAVADDAARLRFFLASTHTRAQLETTAAQVAEALEAIREEDREQARRRAARRGRT